MNIGEAFPGIFRRPLPAVERDTKILVAGALLDLPRRDVLPILERESGLGLRPEGKTYRAFTSYALLRSLLQTPPADHYNMLLRPCGDVTMSIPWVSASDELALLFKTFARSRFGWLLVSREGQSGLFTLADVVRSYREGVMETDMTLREVATRRVASLPAKTPLRDALLEMERRRVRRAFISGTSEFVSDREILARIFSPEGLKVARDDPSRFLDLTLEDVDHASAIRAEGGTGVMDAAKLFWDESGAWSILCDSGLVTPWDLVMKPWQKNRLKATASLAVTPERTAGRLVPSREGPSPPSV